MSDDIVVTTPTGSVDGSESAALSTALDIQLRDLATTMGNMVDKAVSAGFTIRKATITQVNALTVPPTVSLNISGDTQTSVDEVRMMNNYTPLVGQTVLLAKQKSEILILGAVAASGGTEVGPVDTGWKKATLAAGSHGGNGNGDIYYRRILNHGSWQMEWRGGWNVSGTNIIAALDPDYRPTSKRSVLVARDVQGGSNVAQIDFTSDGKATLVGGLTSPQSAGSHTHFVDIGVDVGVSASGSSTTGGASTGTNHTHGFSVGVGGSGSGEAAGTSNSGGSHQHNVNNPTWISLNGVSYYL